MSDSIFALKEARDKLTAEINDAENKIRADRQTETLRQDDLLLLEYARKLRDTKVCFVPPKVSSSSGHTLPGYGIEYYRCPLLVVDRSITLHLPWKSDHPKVYPYVLERYGAKFPMQIKEVTKPDLWDGEHTTYVATYMEPDLSGRGTREVVDPVVKVHTTDNGLAAYMSVYYSYLI